MLLIFVLLAVEYFHSQEISYYKYLSVNGEIFESCCVKCTCRNEIVFILGTYRPPNHSNCNLFCDEFTTLLNDFHAENKALYILGDFNINTLSLDNNTSDFVTSTRSLFFLPLIDIPTRVTDNSETLIDNIWTNQLSVVTAGVLVCDVTDHYPIFVSLPVVTGNEKILRKFRDHSREAISSLRNSIQQLLLHFVVDYSSDVNRVMKLLVDNVMGLYNKCCPVRTKHISLKSLTKPWIASSLKSMIKYKHHYFRQYKMGNVSFNFYNSYKDSVKSALRKARKSYFVSKFKQLDNSRDTWKILKTLLNKNNKGEDISLISNNELISAPLDVANEYNNYFANVADTIERRITRANGNPLSYIASITHNQSMFANPSSSSE